MTTLIAYGSIPRHSRPGSLYDHHSDRRYRCKNRHRTPNHDHKGTGLQRRIIIIIIMATTIAMIV